MEFKYIDKVGLEIEGGWNKTRSDLTADGSIHANEFCESVCSGELVSSPFSKWDSIAEYITTNWPTETQIKCGFHVHFSLKSLEAYAALMEKSFFDYFIESMDNWGKEYKCQNKDFWERLQDKNKFCRKQFYPEKQIFAKNKNEANSIGRYTQLHYGYGVRKTIECRLFPTFVSHETGLAATEALLNCVESFLEKNPPKPYVFNKEESVINEDISVAEEKHEIIEVKDTTKDFVRKPFNYFKTAKKLAPIRKIREKKSVDIYEDDEVITNVKNSYIKASRKQVFSYNDAIMNQTTPFSISNNTEPEQF